MKIRVFEAFAGYGSQAMALERLKQDYSDFDYVVVGVSEIEKNAIAAYKAVHGNCLNYGDISKIDWNYVPDFDLFTYSFPCQDVSTAGFQNGLSEGSGTRSSLLWECRKAIIAKKPKYLLMENVPNLVSKKFMPYVQKWMDELASYGYNNYISKLNAKDFGTPQNRNRVFMVSILGDDKFEFPKPFPLDKRLKDILETNVDEKFYIDPDRAKDMIAMLDIKQSDKILRIGHCAPSGHNGCTIVHPEGIAPTVMDNHGCPTAIIEIYGFGRSRDKKGNVVSRHLNSYINCLHTQVSNGRNMDVLIAEQHFDLTFAIRKLTPTECFRLMDVADADIKKIQDAGISKSKQYVLTGNSICVNVLYHIMEQMFCFKESDNRNSQLTLF